MNRFLSRGRGDDRSAFDKQRELQDEDRARAAREREERLQRSIQSTLKSLGKRVDSSHRKLDDRRSNLRTDSKGRSHPEKPNKFWNQSMQKVMEPGKQVASKIGFREDSPRATNFPDLEDFLGRAPDDKNQLDPSPQRGGKSTTIGLSPIVPESSGWKEEDENRSVEIIQLNQDKVDGDSMDFDDGEEEEQQLTVNLTNLVGNSTPDEAQNITNRPRDSNKQKRASQIAKDQYGQTLFDFFKSLDYVPGQPTKGTVRASYKSGRGSYNLYGVPGSKPGDKGKVFIQSQDGFDKDLPPVRLSDKQRDELINNFQELERLTDQSEQDEVATNESPDKRNLPKTPRGRVAVPSRVKHKNPDIQKDNKSFWSSGIEKGNKPLNLPATLEKKQSPKKHQRQFQQEYNRIMGFEETVTPGGPPPDTPDQSEDATPDGQTPGTSIFKSVYNGMLSSMFGGYGGFSGNTPGGPEHQEEVDEKPTLKQHQQPLQVPINRLIEHQRAPRAVSPGDEWKKPQKLPPTRDKSPMLGGLSKPNHPRFGKQKPDEQRSKSFLSPPQPDPFQQKPQATPAENENSVRSFKSGSGSQSLRKKAAPVVMKLTSEDFEPSNKSNKKLELTITSTSKQVQPMDSMFSDYDPYKPNPYPQEPDENDPNLPNVILLVADNVKLIRNNAVPMLQVQLEIIQNAMNYDSDMCMLGLNDVIYVVPEYTPLEYDVIYSRICNGEEQQDFQNFFEHYQNFRYNPTNDQANLPQRMVGLNKNSMTAIERDHYEPDLRGKAFINLKNIPNGHYTIFYLRIGQPISINSRLKVLGKAKNIYININREKIVACTKPQLDLNHSSSRISKRETSKFKIMKAQSTKKRDNKILSLNSDDEDEEVVEKPLQEILEQKAEEELQKIKSSVDHTRDDSDMEFEDGTESKKSKVQPPPLQDSKEYYNSTQRMTEAMIQNPQFQIYSIDEEESQRTSMRDSVQTEDQRRKNDYPIIPEYEEYRPPMTPNEPTPHPDAPEDAFRNAHRNNDEEHSVTKNSVNMPRPSTKDEISKKIEEYQKQSLMQLANFMASDPSMSTPQSQQHITPQAPDQYRPPEVPPLQLQQQPRSEPPVLPPPQAFQRRDSVNSQRSVGSRGSRGTRVKTINLKDLEDPEPKAKTPWSPGQVRVSPNRQRSQSQHSRSSATKLNDISRPRSSSSKRGNQEEPIRETIKGGPPALHQRERSATSRSHQRSQSGEGGRRPWGAGSRPVQQAQQRSRSRPQSNSKPFPGNLLSPQTPTTDRKFDRYGNPLNEPERPRSQAQEEYPRAPSRGQKNPNPDSDRHRFFRNRSNSSQGGSRSRSASDMRRKQPLGNTFLAQKQKNYAQFENVNENFSDDGQSPVRAEMIQSQQLRSQQQRRKRF